jgi:leucyl/phenylalanyl-tRNA--protein transferase
MLPLNEPPVLLLPGQPFPFPYASTPDGLVAIGDALHPDRLIEAYSKGLFPWFEQDGIPFWFSPDPRCVLVPSALKVSNSMRQLFRKQAFRVTTNEAFEEVINACATTPRRGQEDTWISEEFIVAYTELFKMGYAESAEVWNSNDELVGGLYGVRLGEIFFGESMFTKESNASKYGFITFVLDLEDRGVKLIDCQQETPHLLSLGAINISRTRFLTEIGAAGSGS